MKPRNELSGLAHRLIVHAAHRAPAILSERLKEEWLADFEYRAGAIARLRLAIGCWWAAAAIGRDFGASQFVTSGASVRRKVLLRGVANELLPSLSFSPRAVVVAFLGGFQVFVFAYFGHLPHSQLALILASPMIETTQRQKCHTVIHQEDES